MRTLLVALALAATPATPTDWASATCAIPANPKAYLHLRQGYALASTQEKARAETIANAQGQLLLDAGCPATPPWDAHCAAYRTTMHSDEPHLHDLGGKFEACVLMSVERPDFDRFTRPRELADKALHDLGAKVSAEDVFLGPPTWRGGCAVSPAVAALRVAVEKGMHSRLDPAGGRVLTTRGIALVELRLELERAGDDVVVSLTRACEGVCDVIGSETVPAAAYGIAPDEGTRCVSASAFEPHDGPGTHVQAGWVTGGDRNDVCEGTVRELAWHATGGALVVDKLSVRGDEVLWAGRSDATGSARETFIGLGSPVDEQVIFVASAAGLPVTSPNGQYCRVPGGLAALRLPEDAAVEVVPYRVYRANSAGCGAADLSLRERAAAVVAGAPWCQMQGN